MRFALHALRMMWEVARYGVSERYIFLVVIVLLGALLLLVATTSQVIAPVTLYPFA